MGHTYSSLHIHCVFSTKGREPWISEEIQEPLWTYMGGIMRRIGLSPLCVGGVADHVHLLSSLPTTISVGKAIQTVKANSSRWIRTVYPTLRSFGWQEGYSVFSVSASLLDRNRNYIERKRLHHAETTFEQEYERFLVRHDLKFDERRLWD